MNTDRDKLIKLLESKIENVTRNIVKRMLRENDEPESKRGDDTIDNSQTYKRQYKAIEKALASGKVDATGVMSAALGIDLTKDDSARSHAFKKLHKEKTPDGSGTYKFDQSEVASIFNNLP